MAEKINNREITDELKKNFILYAKDINKSRAFPHLLPGIKPIAGHALWAMYVNGRRFNGELWKKVIPSWSEGYKNLQEVLASKEKK